MTLLGLHKYTVHFLCAGTVSREAGHLQEALRRAVWVRKAIPLHDARPVSTLILRGCNLQIDCSWE